MQTTRNRASKLEQRINAPLPAEKYVVVRGGSTDAEAAKLLKAVDIDESNPAHTIVVLCIFCETNDGGEYSFPAKAEIFSVTDKRPIRQSGQASEGIAQRNDGDAGNLAGRSGGDIDQQGGGVHTDPRTEIPPTDLLPRQRIAFEPHIFSKEEIERILAGSWRQWAGATRFYCLGRYTIYGLLSVTGMRVGEVLNLDTDDVDLDQGVITIRNTKFGKSRLVPVHETTRIVLQRYRDERDAFLNGRTVKAFFISGHGRRIIHAALECAFRRLSRL